MAEKSKGIEGSRVADGLTKYEVARMIGARALQISMGDPFLLKRSEDDIVKLKYNPIEIAKLEFAKGIIPMVVKRPEAAK